MVRKYLVVVLALFAVAPAAFAGITGILTGKVTDADGKGVAGATVRVLSTTRGGISKSDGKYTIININAGQYDVRVTAVGYDTATKRVTISADQTVNLNFTLTQGGVQMKAVDVTAEREMIRSTDVGTVRSTKGSDMTKMARDNVASAISLNAGITASGNNFTVRGSRETETQVLVDGLTITDQFSGGFGNSGATVSSAMPSPFATEEVQSQTGGFGAEYGNAVGGIVNTVVKTGKTDRFEGLVRWRKDAPFLYGTAGNGIEAGAPNEDVVDVTLGGPIGINRSTFFVAVRNTYQNFRNVGLQVLDPAGNNLGQQPNNRTWGRNITARLKFQVTDAAYLLVGGMYGIDNFERASWGWLYADQQGVKTDQFGNPILDANGNTQSNGFIERSAKQAIIQDFSSNAFAQINHTLGQNTVYELRASYNAKKTEIGKRVTPDAPDIFTGWDLHYPEDNLAIDDRNDTALYVQGSNVILDAYEYLRTNAITEDGYAQFEVTRPNPITGFVEGPGDAQTTRNPYGLFNYFNARGNETGVDLRRASFFQLDGNITHNLELGDTRHVLKGGFEMRLLTLSRHQNGNPWDGNPFFDFYGNDYGENIYIDPSVDNYEATKAATEEPFTPVTGAIFFQDQIQFKGLIFTPGIRIDYLDPNSLYRSQFDRFYALGEDQGFEDAQAKLYFSPRLTITYPVSDDGRQNFKLAYGIYYQAPPFADFYDNYNATFLRGGSALGNPNLEMQRTNQYEVSYNHQLSDLFALTVTGFYKDIYNQSDLAYVRVVPDPFFQQVMSAYGNSKGIELTLERRTADNWGFNVNYTLMSATGTANNSGTVVSLDPYTGNPAFPVEPFPLSFDRRHRVNMVLNFFWGNDEGPMIAGIPFLEYFSINMTGFWQSGAPYTPVNAQGQAIGAINSARFPSFWNSDLRIVRTIPLQDLIGGNTSLDIFLDVTNLLNNTEAISYYTRTGSPDNDGFQLNRVPGDFPSTAYFRDADPKNKVTTQSNQYDRVGKRLYNAAADFNSDGVVTAEESYKGYQIYVQDVIDRRGNYQYPRTVFFGITFRF
ncbi:MAG: TonB-dependent receptor [Ignavibacteriae bacterium]|nr:MAG: TonB-dependent receptor [Ignavibacteriota bacterium]